MISETILGVAVDDFFFQIHRIPPGMSKLTYLMGFWGKKNGFRPKSIKAHAYLMRQVEPPGAKMSNFQVDQIYTFYIPIDAEF